MLTEIKESKVLLVDEDAAIWATRAAGGWKVYRRQTGKKARFEGFFLGEHTPEDVLDQLRSLARQ